MLPWRASTGWPSMPRSTRASCSFWRRPALAGGRLAVLVERDAHAGCRALRDAAGPAVPGLPEGRLRRLDALWRERCLGGLRRAVRLRRTLGLPGRAGRAGRLPAAAARAEPAGRTYRRGRRAGRRPSARTRARRLPDQAAPAPRAATPAAAASVTARRGAPKAGGGWGADGAGCRRRSGGREARRSGRRRPAARNRAPRRAAGLRLLLHDLAAEVAAAARPDRRRSPARPPRSASRP